MSDQRTPKEECLYCHGTTKFPDRCPGCSEVLELDETMAGEERRLNSLPRAEGNFFFEFSSRHPHI